MANDLNQCMFIGRLGKDPEMRNMQNGDSVANFSLAVGWKTKEKEGVEWVRCSAFGKLAEIIGKYLTKGSQVYVAGRFQTRKWTNKDGAEQYSTEVNVQTMQMLGGRGERSEPEQAPAQRAAPAPAGDPYDDEIPFAPRREVV